MNISIIIATYNRSKDIIGFFDSVLDQEITDEFEYELVVVDNNSIDDTKEIIHNYEDKFSGRLRYLFESKRGKSNALNYGVQNAKGEIFIFTDDDVILDPQWLKSIWKCYQEHDCDGVGGRILPIFPPNTPLWIKENRDYISGPLVIYDRGESTKKYDPSMIEFLGANYSFKREVFNDCGLFRTDVGPGISYVGEDTEFVNRAYKAGKNLYYCGKALVRHPTNIQRMKLKYIAKWSLGLGKYRFIVDEKGIIDENLVCYFGIPRYLIREIIMTALSLSIKLFNKREFLKSWKVLFINLGRTIEMRKVYLCSKSASL